MSAICQVKCVLCRQVQANRAGVGLVQSVRHLPECFCEMWWEIRWALKATIHTSKHSTKRSCFFCSSAVKFKDLRPRKRFLLAKSLHLCVSVCSVLHFNFPNVLILRLTAFNFLFWKINSIFFGNSEKLKSHLDDFWLVLQIKLFSRCQDVNLVSHYFQKKLIWISNYDLYDSELSWIEN